MRLIRLKTTSRADSGFTLVEALVALALVALSLVAIGSLVGTTTRSVRALDQHVAVVETARRVATNLPAIAKGPPSGESNGLRWQVNVSPFTDVTPVRDSRWIPQRITIRVELPSGARFNLETVRLQQLPPRE